MGRREAMHVSQDFIDVDGVKIVAEKHDHPIMVLLPGVTWDRVSHEHEASKHITQQG